uniref:Uncharacterized protein n=1 Tax=Setaria italica TaxID=4555 RepID=K3ZAI2_SETIT
MAAASPSQQLCLAAAVDIGSSSTVGCGGGGGLPPPLFLSFSLPPLFLHSQALQWCSAGDDGAAEGGGSLIRYVAACCWPVEAGSAPCFSMATCGMPATGGSLLWGLLLIGGSRIPAVDDGLWIQAMVIAAVEVNGVWDGRDAPRKLC